MVRIIPASKPFELNSSGSYYSVNIGYNHSPSISYYLEPMFFSTPQYFNEAIQMNAASASGIFADFDYSPVFVRFGVRYRI